MCPTDLAQVGQEWWAEAASSVALKVALPSAVKVWMGDLWEEYIAFGKSENQEGIGCGVKGLNHWHSI